MHSYEWLGRFVVQSKTIMDKVLEEKWSKNKTVKKETFIWAQGKYYVKTKNKCKISLIISWIVKAKKSETAGKIVNCLWIWKTYFGGLALPHFSLCVVNCLF